jgi:hypothetical protein
MDPLMIIRHGCEGVDASLTDDEPVGGTELVSRCQLAKLQVSALAPSVATLVKLDRLVGRAK